MPNPEQLEPIPPCRVLYRNGLPCDEIVTERPRVDRTYRRIDIPPATKTPYLPSVRAVGRPRTRPVKPKPHKGEGHAWNRMDAVTVEAILKLQEEGLTAKQIGERFGCTGDTIYHRLRTHRLENPEKAAEDAALRVCGGCGRRKLATRVACSRCQRGGAAWPL